MRSKLPTYLDFHARNCIYRATARQTPPAVQSANESATAEPILFASSCHSSSNHLKTRLQYIYISPRPKEAFPFPMWSRNAFFFFLYRAPTWLYCTAFVAQLYSRRVQRQKVLLRITHCSLCSLFPLEISFPCTFSHSLCTIILYERKLTTVFISGSRMKLLLACCCVSFFSFFFRQPKFYTRMETFTLCSSRKPAPTFILSVV